MSKDAKIGIVVVLVIVAILGFLMFRNRQNDQQAEVPAIPDPTPVVENPTAPPVVGTDPAQPGTTTPDTTTPGTTTPGTTTPGTITPGTTTPGTTTPGTTTPGTATVTPDPTNPNPTEQGAATNPTTPAGGEQTWEYTIKAGDVLETIAKTELGSARRVSEIMKLNPTVNPRNMKIGAKLKMPAKDAVAATTPGTPGTTDPTTPGATTNPTTPPVHVDRPAPRPRPEQPAVRERTGGPSAPIPGSDEVRARAGEKYTVKAGDTLRKIAREQLGDESKWSKIAEANGLVEPYALKAGEEIVLP